MEDTDKKVVSDRVDYNEMGGLGEEAAGFRMRSEAVGGGEGPQSSEQDEDYTDKSKGFMDKWKTNITERNSTYLGMGVLAAASPFFGRPGLAIGAAVTAGVNAGFDAWRARG